jgi:SRSO17 transposase
MLARLLGRLPAAWVAADAVYGPDTWLRAWLEGRGMGYVLGCVSSSDLAPLVVMNLGSSVPTSPGMGQWRADGW